MSKRLNSLRDARGEFTATLDSREIVLAEIAAQQRFGEDVGGGDRILNGEIDSDSAGGRHGMGSVADAEQSRSMPSAKAVDLDREQLDLIPAGDFVHAIAKIGGDFADALAEGRKSCLLGLLEGAFAD